MLYNHQILFLFISALTGVFFAALLSIIIYRLAVKLQKETAYYEEQISKANQENNLSVAEKNRSYSSKSNNNNNISSKKSFLKTSSVRKNEEADTKKEKRQTKTVEKEGKQMKKRNKTHQE